MLCDHPEGHNKIQDKYKETEFVMVHRHAEPNVHDIKPVDGKGQVCTVNWHQLQDLERTQEGRDYKDPYPSEQGLKVPSYSLDLSKDKSPLKTSHPYATHSKGEPPTLSLSTTDKSPLKTSHPYATHSKGRTSNTIPKYHCWCGKWRTEKSTYSECYLLFKVFGQTFLDIANQFQSPKPTLE